MARGLKPCPQIIRIGNKTDIKTNKKYKAASVCFLSFISHLVLNWETRMYLWHPSYNLNRFNELIYEKHQS